MTQTESGFCSRQARCPGGALLAEDGGTGNPTAGSYSLNSGRWTIFVSGSPDSGGYVFLGRIPTSSFNGYIWRNYAGGGAPSFTGSVRWMRLVRAGNSITAYHAPDDT